MNANAPGASGRGHDCRHFPAKTLDYQSPLPALAPTAPHFAREAEELAQAASGLGEEKLGSLMRISPALAKLNAERFRDFADAPERPALFAFAGDVYTGLEAKTLDEPAILFAQDHLRMLSGCTACSVRWTRCGPIGWKWARAGRRIKADRAAAS